MVALGFPDDQTDTVLLGPSLAIFDIAQQPRA
jgi:hypothetical protein